MKRRADMADLFEAFLRIRRAKTNRDLDRARGRAMSIFDALSLEAYRNSPLHERHKKIKQGKHE